MGQTYSVTLTLRYDNENDVIKKMKEFIDVTKSSDSRIDFRLDEWAKEGIGTDKLDDLVKIFITNRGYKSEHREGESSYHTSFDAKYGWQGIMEDMFKYISSVLQNGSKMSIYPDSGRVIMRIKDGNLHYGY